MIVVNRVVHITQAQLDIGTGKVVAVIAQIWIGPLGEIHVLNHGIVRGLCGALVDDLELLEDHVAQGVGARIAPKRDLSLQADGQRAVEIGCGPLVQIVYRKPDYLVRVGQTRLVNRGVVLPISVVVVKGRTQLGRPLHPIALVLGAHRLLVGVGNLAQTHVEDLGGV